MRVEAVNSVYYSNKQKPNVKRFCKPTCSSMQNVSFSGKHDCAKFFGGLFGTLGTLGAIGGTVIMTGGVALPFVLGYGALSAGSGLVIGHMMDKDGNNKNKDDENK